MIGEPGATEGVNGAIGSLGAGQATPTQAHAAAGLVQAVLRRDYVNASNSS